MLIDSCESMSLFDQVESPNLVLASSSKHDESAYSHQFKPELNQYLNDHFTYEFYIDLEGGKITEKTTMEDLYAFYPFDRIKSTLSIKHTLKDRTLKDVRLSEFFPVGRRKVEGSKFFNIDELKDSVILQ
jgi:glycosylphosphatidylinositol transamidase (GPIT) subunit GPI8